ncbi:hypothetical protein [Bradyrhizobium canariense]|uniref:hypothetical protein n=1 Tax=Bradyrhizobium canariense TaxID=255045 RepID=UPI001B8A6270|nr:hypothetical protein [Bradyrhizobium canariense]MBR0954578.1 hypothetical protein [Bradyrhizobium canariense]
MRFSVPSLRWQRIGQIVAALVVFAAASSLLLAWLGTGPSNTNVIEEWNATISKLGIDPVFPPEEDVAVGDIYAVLDDSENGQPSRTALALRSIKLTHQDLTADLDKAYRQSYLFPNTKPRPTDQTRPWDQEPNAEGILSHPEKRTTLPIAAFPGFTIKQQSGFSGGLLGWLSTTFGFKSDSGIELNIPVAETYGIPSIEAVGELEKFCSDRNDPNRCTDETLRRHLAFVTPRAFDLKPKDSNDPSTVDAGGASSSSSNPYRYPLQVVLVNRVYLARYIDQSTHRSRSGETAMGGPGRTVKLEKGTAANTPETTTARPAGNETTLQIETSNGQSLKQTFLRPIAIGYRAVKRIPKDNVIDPKTDTSLVKAAVSQKVQACFNGLGDCSRDELGSTPPLAINTAQATSSVKQDNNDPKRFRLYLHTAGQPDDVVNKVKEALTKAGYAVQGSEADADTQGGAGIDYFNEADGVGAANVAKLVSNTFGGSEQKLVVPPRRQRVYNPIGVLGVWLPGLRS